MTFASDYRRLVYTWTRYQSAITAHLYPDPVQAWGMAFADEWHRRKDDICRDFAVDPDEFTYSMKTAIMFQIAGF